MKRLRYPDGHRAHRFGGFVSMWTPTVTALPLTWKCGPASSVDPRNDNGASIFDMDGILPRPTRAL